MALLPKVKLKAIVSFPANISDGAGIDVVRDAGTYQFNLAYDDFAPPVSGLSDAAHQNALLWNSVTGAYVLVPLALLASGGAVTEAPNDGVQYGRQSLSWTPIPTSTSTPSNANPAMDGVAAPGVAVAYSRGDHVHPTDTSRAPLANPTFTGVPAAPTAPPGTGTTQLATTAFVSAAVTGSGTFIDAPSDGSSYGRLNAAWAKVLPQAGGTLTGPLTINASNLVVTGPGTISAIAKGNVLGTASGTAVSTPAAPAVTDANVLLYNFGAGSWCGIGVDTGGQFWLRTGLSGTPLPAFYVDTGQVTHFLNAPLASTAAPGDNSTKLATTAFVQANAAPLRGYIDGLLLSTAGASASFAVAPGMATDSTGANPMALAAAITKTTTAWAVGSGNGSFDGTGAAPSASSNWYHVHLIKRTDTGVVDVLTSLSATAPTLPSPYTLFRRIGSMKTNGAFQWIKFIQTGNLFVWDVSVNEFISVNPGTAAVLRTLTVPTGVKVLANMSILTAGVNMSTDYPGGVYLTDPSQTDTAASGTIFTVYGYAGFAGQMNVTATAQCMTNTSAQIRTRVEHSAAGTNVTGVTHGWVDQRGGNA